MAASRTVAAPDAKPLARVQSSGGDKRAPRSTHGSHAYSSNISMQVTPHGKGEAPPRVRPMVQTTLNSHFGVHKAPTDKPTTAPQDARPAGDDAGGGGDDGGGQPPGGEPPPKRARGARRAASSGGSGSDDAASEALGLDAAWVSGGRGCVRDASRAEALRQLSCTLAGAHGCVLALLYRCQAGPMTQYHTSCTPLTRQQQQLLRKAQKGGGGDVRAGCAGEAMAAAGGVRPSAVAAVAMLPITDANWQHLGADAASIAPTSAEPGAQASPATAYVLPLDAAGQLPAAARQLLQRLLTGGAASPCVCAGAKDVLVSLAGAGLALLPASALRVADPLLLGWLLEPHLLQQRERQGSRGDGFSQEQLLARHGLPVAPQAEAQDGRGVAGPLLRLHADMAASARLTQRLAAQLEGRVSEEALLTEMRVVGVLAGMESAGVCCRPGALDAHAAAVAARMDELSVRAATLLGRPLNLASPAQLAVALYEDLRLAVPSACGRQAASTHGPTDEAALRGLSQHHPLPALVLEYRCLANCRSKWMDSPWVQAARAEADAAGDGCARVRCSWNQASVATGRLSSCNPNLQAVTRYEISAGQADAPVQEQQQVGRSGAAAVDGASGAGAAARVNIRAMFVAPRGRVLLSADYSQVELRLLAHFSGDERLQFLLRQAGQEGDVFALLARQWLLPPGGELTRTLRERAKRVAYGIAYGMSAWGLAQQLSQAGGPAVSVAAAQQLLDSFLAAFPGVNAFVHATIASARATGAVRTLLGRVRPLEGLHAPALQARKEAERKCVNALVQGSAADLMKCAMLAFDDWTQQEMGHQNMSGSCIQGAPALLVASIHDELLVEADAQPSALARVAAAVRHAMVNAAGLAVPLRVNIAAGASWGALQPLEPADPGVPLLGTGR